MTREEILEANGCDIEQLQNDKVLFFESPDYRGALVGMTYDNQHAVYDYDLMIQNLMENEEMTYEEAIEFIDYNSSFSVPQGNGQAWVSCLALLFLCRNIPRGVYQKK